MTSLTEAAKRRPSWRALTVLAHLERLQRASDALSPLRVADGRLLWLFSDHQPRTLKEIAEELRLEQSTVNRQVNAAVSAGVLRRFREPDQTAWHFIATEAAVEDFSVGLQRRLGVLEEAMAAIPAREREEFFGRLDDFVEGYSEALGRQAAAATPGS